MSKERAQRRAEHEREAAVLSAARAAEAQKLAQRRERREARMRAVSARLPKRRKRPTGILAERRRTQSRVLVLVAVIGNALVWFATGDWYLRFLALVLTALLVPLVHVLITRK